MLLSAWGSPASRRTTSARHARPIEPAHGVSTESRESVRCDGLLGGADGQVGDRTGCPRAESPEVEGECRRAAPLVCERSYGSGSGGNARISRSQASQRSRIAA